MPFSLIDPAWQEFIQNDFKTLMSNVKKVNTYDEVMGLQEVFNRFRDTLDFSLQNFLNTDLPKSRRLSRSEISKVDEIVRDPYWALSSELRLPILLTDEYHDKEERFTEYTKRRESWVRSIKKSFKTFLTALDTLTTFCKQDNLELPALLEPTEDVQEWEGFGIVARNFDEKYKDNIPSIKAALKVFRQGLDKYWPTVKTNLPTIMLEFRSDKYSEGGHYEHYSKSIHLNVPNLGKDPKDLAQLIAHECGHHIYQEVLRPDARHTWDTFINQHNWGSLEVREILQRWPEGCQHILQFPKFFADTDPEFGLQVGALAYAPSLQRLHTKKDFDQLLQNGQQLTVQVPRIPITPYGAMNSQEAFCEVVGLLLSYGPKTLHGFVLNLLGVITGGSVKTASLSTDIRDAAKTTNTDPTEGQIEAGNYRKGTFQWQGLTIAIENPKGSTRSGVDAEGNEWESTMNNHYGYIKGFEAIDGDAPDVFLGPKMETSDKVFIVNQVDTETRRFDEHKIMLGFTSEEEAKKAYLSNYEKGWTGCDSIKEIPVEEFKEWLNTPGKLLKKAAKPQPPTQRFTPEVQEIIKTHTIPELVSYDWDKVAFGFSSDTIITVPTKDLKVKYKEDAENVKGEDMRAYFKGAPFESLPPIEVSYEKGRFWIEDGHHRWAYAKQLKKPTVEVVVSVKDNPLTALGLDIDDIIRWKKQQEKTSSYEKTASKRIDPSIVLWDVLPTILRYKMIPRKKIEALALMTPGNAVRYARRLLKQRWLDAEDTILTSAIWSFVYARYVVGDPWPEAEPIIATDAGSACSYAEEVLKHPWPEAEPVIMKDSKYASLYATNVLKRPWPEAEEAISQGLYWAGAYLLFLRLDGKQPAHPELFKKPKKTSSIDKKASRHISYSNILGVLPIVMQYKLISKKRVEASVLKSPEAAYDYSSYVLNRPWPEAEPVIMKDPRWAYRYAKGVLKRPWPEAEPVIATSPGYTYWYAKNILKHPWPEAEAVIMTDPKFAGYYAQDVLKRPWPEAEPVIAKDISASRRYLEFLESKNLKPAHPELFKKPKGSSYEKTAKVSFHGTPHDFDDVLKWKTQKELTLTPKTASKNLQEGVEGAHVAAFAVRAGLLSMKKTIPLLRQSPGNAFYFAETLARPIPELEDTIAKDSWFATYYAVYVLKPNGINRFEKGEPAIAQRTARIIEYASKVIEGRFPAGEERLLNTPGLGHIIQYVTQAVKGPFPEAEQMLSEDDTFAPRYLRVLNEAGRTPAHPELFKAWKKHFPQILKNAALKFREGVSLVGEKGARIETEGGYIDIQHNNLRFSPRSQSVVDFVVDESKRGQGVGTALLQEAVRRYPDLGGQVSSPASLKVFYNCGFRDPANPTASFQETMEAFNEEGHSLYMSLCDEDGDSYVGGNKTSSLKIASKSLKLDSIWRVLPVIRRHKMISQKKVEKVVLQSPKSSYYYALNVLKPAGIPRFELGEPTIAKDPKLAYSYAWDVLKPAGIPRFELGEPAIAKDPKLAYSYARDVLKPAGIKRFELGEPIISKHPHWAYSYALNVLKPAGLSWESIGYDKNGNKTSSIRCTREGNETTSLKIAKPIKLPDNAVKQVRDIILTVMLDPPAYTQIDDNLTYQGPSESEHWVNAKGDRVCEAGPLEIVIQYKEHSGASIGRYIINAHVQEGDVLRPPTLKVLIPSHWLSDTIKKWDAAVELNSVILHELTHLFDPNMHEHNAPYTEYRNKKEVYFNSPAEIRAMLQQMAQEIWAGVNTARMMKENASFEAVLNRCSTWRRIESILNPANRKKVLKQLGVVYADTLQEIEALAEQGIQRASSLDLMM